MFYYPSDRWDVLTDKNILIKLPSKNLYKSLDLAKKILGDSNFSEKKVIDLRIDNQLIVKWWKKKILKLFLIVDLLK